jgi:alanyl-tRNA synthetase
VTQKGSLVAPDRLRFDFSHSRAMTPEEIAAVEQDVNARIRINEDVETRLMTPDAAIAAGAMALFGEKYGEEVRVVSMGGTAANENKVFSTELCGGTHVRRTGDIGLFKIVSEGAVGAGVRRIEAVTGAAAEAYVAEQQHVLNEAATQLKTLPSDLNQRIAALLEERKRLERELSDARKKAAVLGAGGAKAETGEKLVAGITFAPRNLQDVPAKELKGMADEIKRQIGSGVVALVAVSEGKASLVVGVTEDLTAKLSAVDLVKIGSAALGGQGGGGRADMAQAGGPDGTRAGEALAAIERAIGERAQAA